MKIDFWSCGAAISSNVAHAYQNGKAVCGSDQSPSGTKWPTPGSIGCKKCRRAILKAGKFSVWCPHCAGKGRQTMATSPKRRTITCRHCDGMGYTQRPPDPSPFELPPQPNTRPWLP